MKYDFHKAARLWSVLLNHPIMPDQVEQCQTVLGLCIVEAADTKPAPVENSPTAAAPPSPATPTAGQPAIEEAPAKNKGGRPRKHPLGSPVLPKPTDPNAPPKNKGGRPRKHPLPDPQADKSPKPIDPNAPPKNKGGRPRKHPLPTGTDPLPLFALAPPVETPPVEAPPVEAPPVEAPPVEAPPVEAPPVEAPPVEAPPVEAPPVEAPPVEAPPVEAPPVEAPPVEAPPVEAPPVEAPPVEAPPVEAPPVETPPAEAPNLTTQILDLLRANPNGISIDEIAESTGKEPTKISCLVRDQPQTVQHSGYCTRDPRYGNTPITMADPINIPQPAGPVVVTEGILGYYHYHLSFPDKKTKSLCGKDTMLTHLPVTSWGVRTPHLREVYCEKCKTLAEDPATFQPKD